MLANIVSKHFVIKKNAELFPAEYWRKSQKIVIRHNSDPGAQVSMKKFYFANTPTNVRAIMFTKK
jgi:hypothetical protein